MEEERKMIDAQAVYSIMCEALEDAEVRFDRNPEDLSIHLKMTGEDIAVDVIMAINPKKQKLLLLSKLPSKFGEDKRVEGAVAAQMINWKLATGAFDYDMSDGTMLFRNTLLFDGAKPSKGLILMMIGVAVSTVDDYNDKLLMLAKGYITISKFGELIDEKEDE